MSLLPGKLLLVQRPINKRERQEGAFYAERNADDDKTYKAKKKQIIFRGTFTRNGFAFQEEKCLAESAVFVGGVGRGESYVVFKILNSNSLAKKKKKDCAACKMRMTLGSANCKLQMRKIRHRGWRENK